MSKVQERGLLEALGEAEGLARVLRTMSDGRLDLQPTVSPDGHAPWLVLSWEAAKTEARSIAGTLGKRAELTRVQETFCSVCGHLDEPGVHTMADCPRYVTVAGSTPMVITDDIALNMAANVLDVMGHEEVAAGLRHLLPKAEGKVHGQPYQEPVGKWGQPAEHGEARRALPVEHNPKAAEHDGYAHVGIPPHCPACTPSSADYVAGIQRRADAHRAPTSPTDPRSI